MNLRVGILTVSDRASAGTMADAGGPAVESALVSSDWQVVARTVVPDDQPEIERVLRQWADVDALDVIFTTGGTGLSERDVTPEATMAVASRVIPGIGEALRAAGSTATPMSMLSRSVGAVRNRTLIINLPGSPTGARDGVAVVSPVLQHAIATLRGAKH